MVYTLQKGITMRKVDYSTVKIIKTLNSQTDKHLRNFYICAALITDALVLLIAAIVF
jgi:hypothetical protein